MKSIPHSIIKFLAVVVGIALLSQVLFSRGLALDGVHVLYKIIMTGDFYFVETARTTSIFFLLLPSWLFINFVSSNSLSLLTGVFSFGLIWIHIIAFIGCYLILPKQKKVYMFFPLFSFLIGPLTGLGASIASSHSVHSYIWFAAFVIHYSNLSFKSHKILFILSLIPLFLSHELMSYMAWPLIYLCWLKVKTQNALWNKRLIKVMMFFLFLTSIVSIFFIIFPTKSEIHNRREFFQSLFYMKFFFKIKNSHIEWVYPPCIIAFFLSIMPFGQFFSKRYYKLFVSISIVCIILFGVTALILPFYNLFEIFKLTEEEEIRTWITCMALPLSFLIWWLFEKGNLKVQRSFLVACIFSAISLTGWRLGSDYQFYQFQKQFSHKTLNCKGFVFWSSVKVDDYQYDLDYDHVKDQSFYPQFLKVFNHGWKFSSSSLIYPRKFEVNAIVRSVQGHVDCYRDVEMTARCEINLSYQKNNRFFNFDKTIDYDKKNISVCY